MSLVVMKMKVIISLNGKEHVFKNKEDVNLISLKRGTGLEDVLYNAHRIAAIKAIDFYHTMINEVKDKNAKSSS